MKTASLLISLPLLAAALPFTSVLAADRGAARTATPAESLKVLDGFKVELLRSAQPGEGSWVALTTDPKGRLILSPQGKEPMLRITLDGQGQIAKLENDAIPANVSGAMGLLYANNSLYVNGQGPDGYHMYRLTDTDGDDKFDKVELIRRWEGGTGEHGAHGIVLGPDKKLYVVCGNFVGVPRDLLPTSPHKNYADDLILPRAEDGNGFGAGKKPPGGYVVRMDLDGKNCELFASGQRNTYDIGFNTDGELFGFDSDMEWDWGMPWYRPIRAFHAVSGGDTGFREGSGKWPEYYADSLPAVVNIGVGSPTGVRFGTGARFPRKYQRAFYMMDWSYGRIIAVHLMPKGASYAGTFENLVVGKPLNVTDFEIGPDGALYFATGGRGTQSGLYRVSYTEKFSDEKTTTTAAEAQAAEARALRHKLETFHGHKDAAALDAAWPHLNSEDRFIRYAARIAIESQPVEEWQKRALAERDLRASLTALLALARLGDKETQNELFEALGKTWDNCESEEQKLDALRVAQVAFARMGHPKQEVAEGTIKSLDAIYPAKSVALNRELCQMLIYLEAPGVVKKTLELLAKADTQEEQITYVFALRTMKQGWTMDDRKAYFSWFNKPSGTADDSASRTVVRNTKHSAQTVQWFKDVGRDYGDGASFPKFIANIRKDAVATLSDDERGELASLITAPATTGQVATKPAVRKFVREWKMSDFANTLDQAGKGRNFERGKEAYAVAQCLACHRFGNEGGSTGPDITAVSSRFSRVDLLSSILEPSKVISEQYQNITVTKKDGDDLTGRLVEDTDTKLVLITNPLSGEKTEIKKNDVKSRAPSKVSPMPEGLVNILSKDEILDLLAYIESAGKKQAAAFKPKE
jgi:putative heme-binding domain-containing protein